MPWESDIAAQLGGRRILVTGHTGFKGTWLSLWLETLGAEVSGISLAAEDHSLYSLAGLTARWPEVLGDIRLKGTVEKAIEKFRPELVIHLAAQPLVGVGYQQPVETFETNVIGTMNVLEAVRKSPGVSGCIVITTDKVYRPHDVVRRHVESDALGAHDPYSASKASAEHVADAWRVLIARETGAVVVTARAGNVIGGGDFAPNRLLPDLVRAFVSGEKCNVRHPDFTRPWQHVLDPLSGYLALVVRILSDQPVPTAINFGPDHEESVAAIADSAAEQWGGGASWVAVEQRTSMPETPLLALDSGLAREALNWRPTWSTKESVARTVSWWKSLHDGSDPVALCLADLSAFASTGSRQ